ncbi:hypothetical protein RKD19_001607 [Streptomyces canus]
MTAHPGVPAPTRTSGPTPEASVHGKFDVDDFTFTTG